MARDRVYINAGYREFVDALKEKDQLGFKLVENKDSFMLAVALGILEPIPVKSKDGWFLIKNIKTAADKALISSVLLGTAKNDDEMDEYADIDLCLDLCEQCAESGFQVLRNKVNEANADRDLLERRLLRELDLLYTKNVENDI